MRNRPIAAALLLATCVATGCQSADEGDAASTMAMETTRAELAHADLQRTVEIAHEKFTALADAMPEGTYAWQPMEGVRSVGDVFQHVAADNFFVPALMGVAPPPETGVTSDVMTFRAYQERTMSKEEIVAAVDASFVFLLGAMESTADDLTREITLGQSPTTVGDVWIRAIVHVHEHLGQSIAYARSSDIVPPWSR